MTIDLKWGLPFALPVALLVFFKLFFWLAGVPASDGKVARQAFLALSIGAIAGFYAAMIMDDNEIFWRLRIGGRAND